MIDELIIVISRRYNSIKVVVNEKNQNIEMYDRK